MGACNSTDPCRGCFGGRYTMERKFSSASVRQQTIIIDQLRESQKKTKKSPVGSPNRNKIQRIVPMNIAVTHLAASRGSVTEDAKKEAEEKIKMKLRRDLEKASRSLNEETNLKSALTHPTIIKFLRAFMIAQSTEHLLDFYLDVAEIKGLERNRYHKDAHKLWKIVVYKYVLDSSPEHVLMSPVYQEMVAGKLMPGRRHSASVSMMAAAMRRHGMDRRVSEGLQLAQHEVFLAIKGDSWSLFCHSDIFANLLRKKEVRTTLLLERPKHSFNSGGSFLSIMGSECHAGESCKSDVSGDSRRTSAGSGLGIGGMLIAGLSQTGLVSAPQKDRDRDRDKGGEHLTPNMTHSMRKDTRNNLLSSVLKEMGASIESAQQQQYLTPPLTGECSTLSPHTGRVSYDSNRAYTPLQPDSEFEFPPSSDPAYPETSTEGSGSDRDRDIVRSKRALVLEMLGSHPPSTRITLVESISSSKMGLSAERYTVDKLLSRTSSSNSHTRSI